MTAPGPAVSLWGHDISGATANRPTNLEPGMEFFDTTLNQLLVWNGTAFQGAGALGSGAAGQTVNLALMHGRNVDGTVLDATGGAGKHKIQSTPGTSESLQGEAAQNNTKTDNSQFEVALPASYVPGANLTVTINAQRNVSAGTTLTTTVVPLVYRLANDGTSGANLVTTAAAAVTGTATDFAFTATGTTLNPGDRVVVKLTSVATEGGNTGTVQNQINSVRLS